MSKRAKKHDEEEHENHERWLLTYADMITLLMVLFIVLFSMATVDARKFAALRDSLAGVQKPAASLLQGNPSVITGGVPAKLDTSSPSPQANMQMPELPSVYDAGQAKQALDDKAKSDKAKQEEAQNLEQAKQEIEAAAAAHGMSDAVKVAQNEKGLVITVVNDKVLFDTGKADLRPEGAIALDALGNSLKSLPNQLAIIGHTDNVPISTSQYPSNWELSTARAASVLRYLVDRDSIAPTRVGATGFADTRPVAPNDSDANRAKNRRVEIDVLATYK